MKKRRLFVSFLIIISVISIISISSLAKNGEKDYLDGFLVSHIHINLSCKGCLTQRKTNAGCAIFKDGRLLLVKHKITGKWGFPGGRDKLNGELAFQTAYRETLEETGLIVSIEDFIAEFKNSFRLYKCDILQDTKKFDTDNVIKFKYFSKSEIADLMHNHRKELRYDHQFDIIYSQFDKLSNQNILL